MADCCPPNSFPGLVLNDQNTVGAVVTHKSATFYSTGNLHESTGRRALITIPDIFGWNSGRTRKIADVMATQLNVLVVVLRSLLSSYKGGEDGLPADYDFATATDLPELGEWIKSVSQWDASLKGRVTDLFEYLDSQKCSGVGLVGYCWGGWGTSVIAANFTERVKCQAIPHPSVEAVEHRHSRDPTILCKRIKCPTFLLPGGNDPDTYRTGGIIFNILKENNAASKSSEHEFDAVNHGWVVRSNAEHYPFVTKAVDIVIEFFKDNLFK